MMQTESVSWMKSGECIGHDQDLWFANPTSYDASVARQICERCEVRAQCLAYGTSTTTITFEGTGIWGGLDPAQRRALRRAARQRRGAA